MDLSSYAATLATGKIVPFKPAESVFFTQVRDGAMPRGGIPRLTAEEVGLVQAWIAAGALESEGAIEEPEAPPPPPLAIEPTYEWFFAEIVQKRCLPCHTGNSPQTTLDLRTYKSLMEHEGLIFRAVEPGDPDSSGLYLQLEGGTMPPNKANRLTKEELAAVREWVSSGAKAQGDNDE